MRTRLTAAVSCAATLAAAATPVAVVGWGASMGTARRHACGERDLGCAPVICPRAGHSALLNSP
jgi:hypothetical protein